MRRDAHVALQAALSQPCGACIDTEDLRKRFPGVQLDTLISIYAQLTQQKVIRSNHVHKRNMQAYCNRYLEGEDILDICASADFPPCMMLRRMLESLLLVNRQAISAMFKDPSQLATACRVQSPCPQLLGRIQADMQRCMFADACYSPFSDLARQAAGLEYELLLTEYLTALDIPFYTEADLRVQGYFKTPDVWLQVPIAVRDPSTGAWRLVSWIDSKATIGDDTTHSRQMEEQYSTYLHRYGPGLVIYWFGCLDDLAVQDANVMVLDDFPGAGEVAVLPR